MTSEGKSILLSIQEGSQFRLLASNKEEIDDLNVAYLFLNPEEDKKLLKGIEGFGDTKDLLKLPEKVLKKFIPRIEQKIQYQENGKMIVTNDFYCYAKGGIKHPHNNIMIHEDAVSAFNCAIQCIGNPSYVIIYLEALEESVYQTIVSAERFSSGRYRIPFLINLNEVHQIIYKQKIKKAVEIDEDEIIAQIPDINPEPLIVDEVPPLEQVVECINESHIPLKDGNEIDISNGQEYFNIREYGFTSEQTDHNNNPSIPPTGEAFGETES